MPNNVAARPLTLAYSPCPNDTYIFAALANNLLDDVPEIRVALEDVESLNIAALKADYELTKVSYGAVPDLMGRYRILRAGGALGRGCGPLVITRPGHSKNLQDYTDKLIAIPGERTTATLLLKLALQARPHTLVLRFDQIIDAVLRGTVDAGLIIHESRFTYEAAGLEKVLDLGEWWEGQTGLPIPLGGILVRDDVQNPEKLNGLIGRSLQFAREHEDDIGPYVRQHSAENSDEIVRKHIALYVNEYSEDLGVDGMRAVHELVARAKERGFLPAGAAEPQFV
ncbi:MAG: 1,4-dihydroxy-6-naphthoate synthase [Candidatus Meridianibacter frigidus]|nr:MAG: 1,4-dihydroxy-6-naphthoate synthase [Candidatus Eremiobacteraeota bacterium]